MDQVTGGDGRGVGAPPLLTCARAAVPFVAQAALTAVASAAHGLGCAGRSTHRLQLCPPGPTPHIQVSGCPPGLPSIRVCSWGTHWCVQGGHKHRAHSPSCTSQRGPVQPSSQKQEPEPPRPSSQRPWEVQLQAGERDRQDGVGTRARGVREQGRARQHSLPWHRGPKAPGAQSSQAVPAKRVWHLHSPLPLMPSMHEPRWLQGLLAPPGQAQGGDEERGEVRPRQEPRTCTPSPRALENTWIPSPVHQVLFHLHPHLCSKHILLQVHSPQPDHPEPLAVLPAVLGAGRPGRQSLQPRDTHLGTRCRSDQGSSWASRWW